MRNWLWFGAVLIGFVSSEMFACGDKYLSVGRGARYQRGYVSLRPVTIVVLKHAATAQREFLTRLKFAGHRVEVVNNVENLSARLAASKFDVVLADYEDATEVVGSMKKIAAKPLFLPVVDAGSPNVETAHREYGCLLKGDSKAKQRSFLVVLDEAVEANKKAKPLKCDL